MDHHHNHHHQWLASTSSSAENVEREHMFEKIVTPSDVGKLNRLVIPKQYAEKYFPLDNNKNNNNSSSSSSLGNNGLLLNFEDSIGKSWRFRYSYWNSSQSYVMTKGWSRFVKDKKLDAGDIVSFQRGVGEEGDKFFIDWKRRPVIGPIGPPPLVDPYFHHHQYRSPSAWSMLGGGGGSQGFVLRSIPQYQQTRDNLWDRYNSPRTIETTQFSPVVFQSRPVYCNPYLQTHETRSMIFLRPPEERRGPPVVHGKRLRLFGVNMDCPINNNNNDNMSNNDDSSSIVSATSSTIHVATINNNNNDDDDRLDPPDEYLRLRLRSDSDHLQVGKGKSSTRASMSLDFDF